MTRQIALKRRDCKEVLAGLLVADDTRYFVYAATSGRRWLVRADCPHRGGPLNFGIVESERCAIRCPWHRILWPERVIINRSVPAVRVCADWRAIVPDTAGHKRAPVAARASSTPCDRFARAGVAGLGQPEPSNARQ